MLHKYPVDFFGQSLLNKDDKAASLYGTVQKSLLEVRTGEITIVDVDDSDVGKAEDSIWSTTQSFDPIFTSTHPDDTGSTTTKRLDEY